MSWVLVERDREWRAFEVAGGHSLNICDFPKAEGTGQSMERSGGGRELLLGMLMPTAWDLARSPREVQGAHNTEKVTWI